MPKGRILAAQCQGIVPKPRVITEAEEACIQKAKLDYEARRYPSIRKAAIAHNVKYDTLRRRIQGLTAPCKLTLHLLRTLLMLHTLLLPLAPFLFLRPHQVGLLRIKDLAPN